MYILLAIIFATAAGALIQVLLPNREVRGVLVSGATAAAVAAVVYAALTWAGVAQSSIWIWLASVGGGIVASLILTWALTRTRVQHDAAEVARLGIA